MSNQEFGKWVDHADELRTKLKDELARFSAGTYLPPPNFTKESYIQALEDQIASVSKSLANFGR